MDYKEYLNKVLEWLMNEGLTVLFILISALITLKIVRPLILKLITPLKGKDADIETIKRLDTIRSVIRYIITLIIISIAIMMILPELGVNIGPILAAAGILGLAVGFGAQQLVQDVISGFFILIEDQIRVGDVVSIAGKAGLVEKVNLRMTILRDLSGNVHYVRNGMIDTVTNMTKEFAYAMFDVGVAYREDVDEVMEVMREVDSDLRKDPDFGNDILEPIEIMGLDKFADSAVVVRGRIKTKPIKQWKVMREFNRRLFKLFNERDIEIPFPHVTLYMGQDKDGSAAAMNVHLKEKNLSPDGEKK